MRIESSVMSLSWIPSEASHRTTLTDTAPVVSLAKHQRPLKEPPHTITFAGGMGS